jgi:hypothetical protein
MAFLQPRERLEAALLLEFKLSGLRFANAVHTEQAAVCSTLGARLEEMQARLSHCFGLKTAPVECRIWPSAASRPLQYPPAPIGL